MGSVGLVNMVGFVPWCYRVHWCSEPLGSRGWMRWWSVTIGVVHRLVVCLVPWLVRGWGRRWSMWLILGWGRVSPIGAVSLDCSSFLYIRWLGFPQSPLLR